MKLTTIIKKELLDQIRDKRTIVASILLPALIVPLLLFLTTGRATGEEPEIPVRIIISENEIYLRNILRENFKDIQFITPSSAEETIINGKADLQIDVIREGDKYSSINIMYDPVRKISSLAYFRIHDLLKLNFNNSDTANDGLQIKSSTIRSDIENKTLLTLSLLLPVLLMVFAASSTMSGIIDMSSGEKERGTIEIILSCNISHTTIILGKISAAAVMGLISIMSLITGLTLCSHFYPQITGGLSLLQFCRPADIIFIILMTTLSIFLFSAAGMAIGLYAKSIKEGTILTLPVIILCSALSSGLMASDPFSINQLYLLIPVLNFSYLIRSAVFSHFDYSLIIITILVNIFYTLLFTIICSGLLKKEAVIFRS